MKKNIISRVLLVLYGLVFIVSALLKLIPPEPFEVHVFSIGLLGWNASSLFARAAVLWELLLGGTIILTNKKRFPLLASLITLFVFSFFLLHQLFFQNTDNCFCMGQLLPMSPVESLMKNGVLLVACIFFLQKNISYTVRFSHFFLPAFFLLSVYFSFFLQMPDYWKTGSFREKASRTDQFPADILNKYITVDVSKGKKILCFFSTSCRFCHIAAQKISIMDRNFDSDAEIIYLFYDSPDFLDHFWNESKSKKYPAFFIPYRLFFDINGRGVPTIFFLNDSKIQKIMGYRTLFEEDYVRFVSGK